MQHIYQLFHGVMTVSQEFWERLCESREDGEEGKEPAPWLEDSGIMVRSERIHIQTDRYPATAGQIVHLFALAAETGNGFGQCHQAVDPPSSQCSGYGCRRSGGA